MDLWCTCTSHDERVAFYVGNPSVTRESIPRTMTHRAWITSVFSLDKVSSKDSIDIYICLLRVQRPMNVLQWSSLMSNLFNKTTQWLSNLCISWMPRPLFNKWYNGHLGSYTAEEPVKFQSNWKSQNTNFTASRRFTAWWIEALTKMSLAWLNETISSFLVLCYLHWLFMMNFHFIGFLAFQRSLHL